MKIYLNNANTKDIVVVTACSCITIITIIMCCILLNKHTTAVYAEELVVPINWDSDYVEDEVAYNEQQKLNMYSEEEYESFASDSVFYTVDTVFTDTTYIVNDVNTSSRTKSDIEIITMSENEAWSFISNGIYESYPKGSFNSNRDKLVKLQQSNTEVITIKCWFWEDPEDDTNFNKVTKTRKFAVNSSIAQLFKHAFEDIYNHPSKPVINLNDKGMGTWVLRGKNHNGNATMSSHSLGCAIDINPSTGSFNINGTWYGNGYKHKKMSKSIWEQLPECHAKYHVLYDNSPIVETFKSYGFVWGGDWTTGTDCMHLSFIGDGQNARSIGFNNYLERK